MLRYVQILVTAKNATSITVNVMNVLTTLCAFGQKQHSCLVNVNHTTDLGARWHCALANST